MQYVLNVTTS